MGIRIKRRKKHNIIDNKEEINKEEFLKRLDEHIKWIKERQIKSENEKLVEWELVEKEEKGDSKLKDEKFRKKLRRCKKEER